MLTPETLPEIQRALTDAGLDGWLLYDFRGSNPIAAEVLSLKGMATRRIFVLVPRTGVPVAITHNIEQGLWRQWPSAWRRERYSAWRLLEQHLHALVNGKRVAMEYSPGDAVPYVDRVPAGVLEMVRAAGATVFSSGELVTRFYAVWSAPQLASHERAAAHVARIAREGMAEAGARVASGKGMMEHELQRWLVDAFARAGLEADDPPIVAVGANAAEAHYGPSENRPTPIVAGQVLLVDLWAREPGGVYADQTWMASVGAPSSKLSTVWNAVRDGRDAAIALLRDSVSAGRAVRGADIDDAARGVITSRGFGDDFVHRTGHSIDSRSLHGSGPNMDNFETREERLITPGVGFSIEPGIYLSGELGVRSEVNGFRGEREAIVTPADYQRELIVI